MIFGFNYKQFDWPPRGSTEGSVEQATLELFISLCDFVEPFLCRPLFFLFLL